MNNYKKLLVADAVASVGLARASAAIVELLRDNVQYIPNPLTGIEILIADVTITE